MASSFTEPTSSNEARRPPLAGYFKPQAEHPPPLGAEFDYSRFLQLNHGSRQPGADPVWVTPEVTTGGFSTGRAMAALLDGESNADWLSTPGFFRLSALLDAGNYRVVVPEHGALLCIVWLLRRGREGQARVLLRTLEPYFDKLRFFPEELVTATPEPRLVATADDVASEIRDFPVCQQTVRVLYERLSQRAALSPPASTQDLGPTNRFRQRRVQIDNAKVWAPLRADAVALVELLLPRAATTTKCSELDDAWAAKAGEWLTRVESASETVEVSGHIREGIVGIVRRVAHACADGGDRARLTAQLQRAYDEHKARVAARGHADDSFLLRRVHESEPVDPSFLAERVEAIVRQHIDRRTGPPTTEGLTAAEVDSVLAQRITVNNLQLPRTVALPASLRNAVRRSLAGPLAELVKHGGVIPSADAIAQPVDMLQAVALAAGCRTDAAVSRLIKQNALAFRNRRSLLLLNLESQIGLSELPWHQALVEACDDLGLMDHNRRQAATVGALQAVVGAWVWGFPGTIMPNKLVSAAQQLVKASGLEYISATAELAADIFCYDFAKSFDEAFGVAAASVGADSLYARYYGLGDAYRSGGTLIAAASALTATLEARNRAPPTTNTVVKNARVIEAAQILTTHNLVQLTLHPCLRSIFEAESAFPTLAHRAFAHVLNTLENQPPAGAGHFHPRLLATKRVAYAWRQVVFFTSCAEDPNEVAMSLGRALAARKYAKEQHDAVRSATVETLQSALDPANDVSHRLPLAWFGWEMPNPRNRRASN